MPDLSKKRERDRLAIRRDPHFQTLSRGMSLGFRRGPDTWIARFRDKMGVQHYRALEGVGSNDYDSAKKAAEEWFEKMSGSAVRSVKRATVRAGLEAYLADLSRHGRAEAAREALGRFKLCVYGDRLADIALEAATRDDFEEWRGRLTPGRQPRSVNRQVRSVMAGLNRACELGHVGSPAAWHLKPLADDTDDDGETAVFLDAAQRKAIIAASGVQLAGFLRGLELTGARPKELASAIVRDFDGQSVRLAHRKGRPPKLRVRHTVLGLDGVEFFKTLAQNHRSEKLLFTEDGETPWRRHQWSRQMRAAAEAINAKADEAEMAGAENALRVPPGASAYSFRHARISELLQIYGVDPLTTAHQTGTSLAMIEKAYMRFIPAALQEKLAGLREMK